MRFEVYKRSDGAFDWRAVATNGQIVATSGGQGYTEGNDAAEACERFAEDAAQAEIHRVYVP